MVFWRPLRTCGLAATLLVAALVCTSSIHAATSASDRRVALIIGNDTYTHLPALNNARKDAEDMAVKLRELGFETILKVNAGRREMHRALGQFEARLNDGATGLAFFAGHGIQSDGKNYLIPADGFIEVEDDLNAEAITAQHILAAMERAGNPLNIVILDACRDNPLPKRTRSARRGLTVVGIPAGAKGTAILYAAGEGQTAEDGPRGGNGVFTGELLRVLDEPGLSLEQVFKRVNRRVQRRTNNRQRPWSLVSLQGDFVFRSEDSAISQTSAGKADPSMEALFWQTIKDSKNKADFNDYIRRYPNGVFVTLARNRMSSMHTRHTSNVKKSTKGAIATAPSTGPIEGKYNININWKPTVNNRGYSDGEKCTSDINIEKSGDILEQTIECDMSTVPNYAWYVRGKIMSDKTVSKLKIWSKYGSGEYILEGNIDKFSGKSIHNDYWNIFVTMEKLAN
jgi:hypothetical protein